MGDIPGGGELRTIFRDLDKIDPDDHKSPAEKVYGSPVESMCVGAFCALYVAFKGYAQKDMSPEVMVEITSIIPSKKSRACGLKPEGVQEMSMIKGINWESAEEIVSTTSRSLLFGPPGTGKTTCGILMAKRQKKPVYSVTLHADITAQELIGHFIPKGGEFVFHYGPFIRAWKEGGVLIINEICEAGGPVLTALYSILDDPSIAMLTLPNGETVRPKEGFKAIATMNGSLDSIPDPLLDRFEVKIFMGVPHPDAIKKLPKKYHEFIKKAYTSGNATPVTMRSAFALDLLISNGIDETLAFDAVYGDKARDVKSQYMAIKAGD